MQAFVKFAESFVLAATSFVSSAIGYGYTAVIFWLIYADLTGKSKDGWEGMAVIVNAFGLLMLVGLVAGISGALISIGFFRSRNWGINRYWISIALPLVLLAMVYILDSILF